MKERRQYAGGSKMDMQQTQKAESRPLYTDYQQASAPTGEKESEQNTNAKYYMAVPNSNGNDYAYNGGYAGGNASYTQALPQGKSDSEEQIDKDEIEEEHIRYLNETKKLDKIKNKASSDERDEFLKAANIKKATERSVDLIEARMNYDTGIGYYDLAIELLKFTEHSDAQKKEYKENKRRSSKIKKSIKKAKKLERKATKRYYEVLAKEADSLTIMKKAKKQEQLGMILTKLEALLREREDIDARLTAIYKGADSAKGGRIRLRAEKKRYKKAKKVHNSLRASNIRLGKMNVSDSLTTKIRFLFNNKIVLASTVTYSKYLLKKLKPKGNAKTELKKNIKSASASLSGLDRSIKRMMKKAKRSNRSGKTRRRVLTFLVVVLIVAILARVYIYMMGA